MTLTARTATDLRHHHESMLVGPEVGVVEHGVGIEDTHDGHTVEVEALGDHLCTDEEVGATC